MNAPIQPGADQNGADYPTAPKVIAGAGGAGVGAVLGQLVVYLLDTFAYTPAHAVGDTVPGIVNAAVTVVVAAACAWVAGYRAPHQPRVTDRGPLR